MNDQLNALIQKVEATKVYSPVRGINDQIVDFSEQSLRPIQERMEEARLPYPRNARGRITVNPDLAALTESAGAGTTPNFPDLLRQGLTLDVFSGYNEMPATYPLYVRETTSNKQQEEYLRDSGIGQLPVVAEGQPYPRGAISLDGGTVIKNYKRGLILPVSEEMRRFDQLGKVRDIANTLGRAARATREQQVMDVLTTTGNYTRNSTTGDNNIGANQASTTFGPAGLVTAFGVLTTMKDRKTGQFLSVMPDTLIVTPSLWWFARTLLTSPDNNRQGGPTTAEVYGGGTINPFYQAVRQIIVSPMISSSYGWVLMESKRAVVMQVVDGLQVLPPEYDYGDDTWDYRVRDWYGVGMKDDRFAYLSTATAAPAAG